MKRRAFAIAVAGAVLIGFCPLAEASEQARAACCKEMGESIARDHRAEVVTCDALASAREMMPLPNA
jgi:hypothetical protein